MQPNSVIWNYVRADHNCPELRTCLDAPEGFYQKHSPFSLRHGRQNTGRVETHHCTNSAAAFPQQPRVAFALTIALFLHAIGHTRTVRLTLIPHRNIGGGGAQAYKKTLALNCPSANVIQSYAYYFGKNSEVAAEFMGLLCRPARPEVRNSKFSYGRLLLAVGASCLLGTTPPFFCLPEPLPSSPPWCLTARAQLTAVESPRPGSRILFVTPTTPQHIWPAVAPPFQIPNTSLKTRQIENNHQGYAFRPANANRNAVQW
jgi:hypothetical protein